MCTSDELAEAKAVTLVTRVLSVRSALYVGKHTGTAAQQSLASSITSTTACVPTLSSCGKQRSSRGHDWGAFANPDPATEM